MSVEGQTRWVLGGKLRIEARCWVDLPRRSRTALAEQAERLAAHRGVTLSGIDFRD